MDILGDEQYSIIEKSTNLKENDLQKGNDKIRKVK